MDPKMDSGVLDEAEEEADNDNLPLSLQPSEVIGVMDQILCLEVRCVCTLTMEALRLIQVTKPRRPGIWAIPCRKRCSPRCTSIAYYGQSP